MTKTFDAILGDVFDIREVIERFEELDSLDAADADAIEECRVLTEFLRDVCGRGGDEKWCGNWYPVTFIRDSYFEEYARDYAEDTCSYNSNAEWPHDCIDWALAARELRMDYSAVEIDGTTYWYR
jgi:hypothetical protein